MDRAVELARRLPPERVIAAAAYHRVAGCVLASLDGGNGLPPLLVRGLAAEGRRASGRSMLGTTALRAVRAAFGDDLTWLTLKGPILDAALYPRRRLRSYVDLDVLVRPSEFREAVARLEAAGYALTDRNWRLIRTRMASELHLEREGSAPVDLHWTILFSEHLRRTFRFDSEAMIARARTVEVSGDPVRTLDQADTILHLAVHAALEGGDRLVWLKDIDMAVRDDPAWGDVVARARDIGVALPVATMLARSARVLGAPVPNEVLDDLTPASWRRLSRMVDAAFPVAASRGIGSPATLLARSARADLRTTLRIAGRGLVRRAAALRRGALRRVDLRSDSTNPASLRYPRGGPRDRDAYFASLLADGGRSAGRNGANPSKVRRGRAR